MYTGIVCASLPCMKAFFKHHFPNSFLVRDETQVAVASPPLSFTNSRPVPLKDLNPWPWRSGSRLLKVEPNIPSHLETHSESSVSGCAKVKNPGRVIVAGRLEDWDFV
jgi:hypothetical protein